jgi:hypothetical protein
MVAFGHTAVGALVGLASYNIYGSQNPATAFQMAIIGGLASHYLVDTIPHGHFSNLKDYKKKIVYIIIFDLFLSLLIFTSASIFNFGLSLKTWLILTGIAFSQAPDVLDGLIYIGFLKKNYLINMEMAIHEATHWHGTGSKVLAFSIFDIWQVSLFIVSLWIVFT